MPLPFHFRSSLPHLISSPSTAAAARSSKRSHPAQLSSPLLWRTISCRAPTSRTAGTLISLLFYSLSPPPLFLLLSETFGKNSVPSVPASAPATVSSVPASVPDPPEQRPSAAESSSLPQRTRPRHSSIHFHPPLKTARSGTLIAGPASLSGRRPESMQEPPSPAPRDRPSALPGGGLQGGSRTASGRVQGSPSYSAPGVTLMP